MTYPGQQPHTYTYDAVGNRKTLDGTTYTYNAANEMLTAGGVSYGYDNNGNQTSRGADTFDYDHENRLTQSVIGAVTASSVYNGDGLRMSHTVGAQTTSYTWDVAMGLPVVLQDGANTYVYGLDLISATDGAGAQTYFTYDGLGSTTDLTNGAGAVTGQYTYDVFGATLSGSAGNAWQFTGEQRDADSGLYYLRARYYDPATGRFLGRDPSGAGHPYAYVGGSPVNFVDPTGLHCRPWHLLHCPGEAVSWMGGRAADIGASIQHLYENPQGIVMGNAFNEALAIVLAGFSSCERDAKEGGIVLYQNCGGLAGWISDDLFNGATFTIGSFIFSAGEPPQSLLDHEIAHIQQYDWLGSRFLPYYFGNALGALATCAVNSSNSNSVGECAEERNLLELLADEMAGTNEIH